MVGASCGQCGATYRFNEADVPPSGKIVKCARCATPITVMPDGDAPGAAASNPRATSFGLGGTVKPASVMEARASDFGPEPTGDLSIEDLLELDPDAASNEGGLLGVAQPVRRSAIADVEGDAATDMRGPFAGLNLDVGPGDVGLSDDVGSDLLAPVGPFPTRGAGAGKGGKGIVPRPAPTNPPRGAGADIFGDGGVEDLLAPVGPRPTRSGGGALDADLLAPVGPSATRGGRGGGDADLLAPVGPHPTKGGGGPDLLTPVGPHPTKGGGGPDLLTPVGPRPTKGGGPDLLTPVGPSPTKGVLDLPAPKGFFDDGLQPAAARQPDSGFDLPSPRGMADATPPPPAGPTPSPNRTMPLAARNQLPARPAAPPPMDLGPLDLGQTDFDAPMPTGSLGDDILPIHVGEMTSDHSVARQMPKPAAQPFGIDALDLELGGEAAQPPPMSLDLASSAGPGLARFGASVAFGDPSPVAPPAAAGDDDAFADLDLPELPSPSKPPEPAAARAPTSAPSTSQNFRPPDQGQEELALDTFAPPPDPTAPADLAPDAPAPTPRRRQRVTSTSIQPDEDALRAIRKRTRLMGAVAAIGALLVGGYYAYSWYEAREAGENKETHSLNKAERMLTDDAPGHWQQAVVETEKLIKAQGSSPEALALQTEAYYASALDEGAAMKERIELGDKAAKQLRAATTKSPHAEKAFALQAIVDKRYDDALKALTALAKADPKDGSAQLYIGWAHQAKHDDKAALAAFDAAIKLTPNRTPVLYGKGLSQLALGYAREARDTFLKVSQKSRDKYKRDHFGALVGIAQLAEVDKFSDRENRFLEILSRKDLDQADPRAVARAWSLAGDEALRAGRLDEARLRYDKALGLDPDCLNAVVGMATADLRQGKAADARAKLDNVLKLAPGHIEASLAKVDVLTALASYDEAIALADELLGRKPPIESPMLMTRLHLLRGGALEAKPDTLAQAEEEYLAAAKSAEKGDVSPTVALTRLLVKLGRGKEAVALLDPIRVAAKDDPALAVTLGVAYLGSGDAKAAEDAFRAALAGRAGDVEAEFQLGQALWAQERWDEAIAAMTKAHEAMPTREDLGVRLALALEQRKQDDKAGALYDRLLKANEPSINVRSRAGRFFARTGRRADAAAQGEAIAKVSPQHPAGLYLLGEKAYWAGIYAEAQDNLLEAIRFDPDPQYYEALGRASVELQKYDEASRAFGHAIAAAPDYIAPRLGRAKILLLQREYAKAIEELEATKKLAPNDPTVWRDIGKAYLTMRKPAEAKRELETAVRLDGQDAEAHYHLGKAYFDLDRPGPAADQLSRAVQLIDGDPAWQADAYLSLGYAARAAKRCGVAIDGFRQYLALAKKNNPARSDAERMLLRLQAGCS